MNCKVRINADHAEAWVATQNAEAALAVLSTVAGLPLEKCKVYSPMQGGGPPDYVRQAALIRKQFMGTPIKMI
jgi:isoquinoline 1-oxidoreductase beta subunit